MFKLVVLFAVFVAVIAQGPPRESPKHPGPAPFMATRVARQVPGMDQMSQQAGEIPSKMMEAAKDGAEKVVQVGQEFMKTGQKMMENIPGMGKRR